MTAVAVEDGTHTAEALNVARNLVITGIPVFAAAPAPGTKIGFRLPPRWQQTEPELARVEEWAPGWALCMVCGRGLDVVDIDIYAGGTVEAVNGALPRIYGMATTASGGVHLFVASMGVRSANALMTGIDIKAGDAEGRGRGFVFIAPTVKASKVTGEPVAYRWC